MAIECQLLLYRFGPTKVGSTRVGPGFRSRGGDHILASARMLRKYSR